jgi:hypothetical protein
VVDDGERARGVARVGVERDAEGFEHDASGGVRRGDATTSEDAARRGAEISRIDFVVIRFDSFERRARSRVLRD